MDLPLSERISLAAFGIAAAITGCTSIDNSTDDNGFLGCARAHNPGASQHGSTAEAVQHLLDCIGAGTRAANLVGHGTDGLIGTGIGDHRNNPDQYVSLWNRAYWEPYVQRLRGHVTSLSLWACHPGTGTNGAEFLYQLAQVVNSPVSGPTGFVYCSPAAADLWLEPGSVWQVATPTTKPNPINAPTPFFLMPETPSNILLMDGGEHRSVPLSRVTSVEYMPTFLPSAGAVMALSGQDAAGVLSQVQFDRPFRPGGIPAAMVTGRLRVTMEGQEGDEETREFNIYNFRLLQDVNSPDVFYYAGPGLRDALASSQQG